MSSEKTGSRILIVGPVGSRPWLPVARLVETLESLGHVVTVNGSPDFVLPMLEPLPPKLGRRANSAAYLVLWYVRMLLRWRNSARRSLAASETQDIIVWDTLLALLCRVVLPKGARLTWVLSPPEGPRSMYRLLRMVVALSSDRVVTTHRAESRLVVGRDVVVPPVMTPAFGRERVAGWAVLGSEREPSERSLEWLRQRAQSERATALVFNGRAPDAVTPQTLALLREATGARRVIWASDGSWVDEAGGLPEIVVDPSRGLDVDHRHLAALGSGAVVVASADNGGGFWQTLLQSKPHCDGWDRLSVRDGVMLLHDEAEWCHHVFPPDVPDRADAIAREAIAVRRCPVCHDEARERYINADGGVTVFRCRSCGLRYAGEVLPAETVHTADYHSGKGTCGADYVSDGMQPFIEAIADRRLDALASVGIATGRLLDVGAGLGHLVGRARARGWSAEGLDVVPAAAEAAQRLYGVTVHVGEIEQLDAGRFDVVVLGQTLEHMSDPVAVLNTIRERHLASGGHVLIEVPNVRSLARWLQGRRWMHWQPGDHHLYPDPQTSRDILDRAGFTVRYLRSDSLATPGLPESVMAFNLGLLSRRTVTRWPQLGRVLRTVHADRPLRLVTRVVDRAGLGQNVIAIGQAR